MELALRRSPTVTLENYELDRDTVVVDQAQKPATHNLPVRLVIGICAAFLIGVTLGALGGITTRNGTPTNSPTLFETVAIPAENAIDDIGIAVTNPPDKAPTAGVGMPIVGSYMPAVRLANLPVPNRSRSDLPKQPLVNESRFGTNPPVVFVNGLPAGVIVQKMSLERSFGTIQDYRLEVVFWLPNGVQYRLEETRSSLPIFVTPRLLDEGSVSVGGQTWSYGKLPLPSTSSRTIWALRNTAGNRNTSLEGASSLPELIEQLDWLSVR
jgi:hypothetical protein